MLTKYVMALKLVNRKKNVQKSFAKLTFGAPLLMPA